MSSFNCLININKIYILEKNTVFTNRIKELTFSGHPRTENGNNADENHVSKTLSSENNGRKKELL